MPGKLSVTYELPIPDLEVMDPGPFTEQIAGRTPWTATLRPSETGFTLTIDIATDDPSNVVRAADAYAEQIGEHLTFWFCDHVKQAVAPKRLDHQFQGIDGALHVLSGEAVYVGYAPTVRMTLRCAGQNVHDALVDFSLHQLAPPPVFANDIVIARQMYFAAMKVENLASRFFIIYSALAVFSTFKLGSAKDRTQTRIDKILIDEDPAIPMTTPSPQSRRKRLETEFTRARNDFLHAEDRGRNPTSALATIEGLTLKLQTIAGCILRKG